MELSAVGTGMLAVGVVEAAMNVWDESVVDRIGKVVVDRAPIPVVEKTIKYVGTADKPVLRSAVSLALAAGVGAALPGRRTGVGGAVAGLLGTGLIVGSHELLRRRELPTRTDAALSPAAPLPPLDDGARGWPSADAFATPVEAFYVTDVNMRPPVVDVDTWTLEVEGMTGRGELRWPDLLAMDLRERDALLVCVHQRAGWDRLGQQRWTGLPLADVLAACDAMPSDPDGVDLVMEAVDGYRQVLPLRTALDRRSWLVVGMGGQPLPRVHGFPARVMTPGVVGQYNGVKWLRRLSVVPAGTVTATWVDRGWPAEVVGVQPSSRIDRPSTVGVPPYRPRNWPAVNAGTVTVSGRAWAPPHGVERVHVGVDGGPWREAELAAQVNGDSWRRWRLDVELSIGPHVLTTRCVSVDGTVQHGDPVEPFPHGSGVYHTVPVRAV